jgi:hypothetical protein
VIFFLTERQIEVRYTYTQISILGNPVTVEHVEKVVYGTNSGNLFPHIHAEEKIWPQVKWAIEEAETLVGKDDLHFYWVSTQSPDPERKETGNPDQSLGIGQNPQPSCLEDMMAFTKKYLITAKGERQFALKVGFHSWCVCIRLFLPIF